MGVGGKNLNTADVVIKSDGGWSVDIEDSGSGSHSIDGFGDRTIQITCKTDGKYSITVQRSDERSGTLDVEVVKNGLVGSSQRSTTTSANGIISLSGTC
ncbi:MAG: hypothetical protein ACJ70M_04660 [Nitrososphaera sp.]